MHDIANQIAKMLDSKGKDRGKKGDHDTNSLKAHSELPEENSDMEGLDGQICPECHAKVKAHLEAKKA
jgi:hypothetical protein